MKKRMISFLVLAAMLLTILPVTALAEDELVAVEAPEIETAVDETAAEEITADETAPVEIAAEEITAEEAPAEEITAIDEIAVEEADTYLTAASSIANPRIIADSSTVYFYSGQKVTYDCIWFGSYPQAEVVSSKNMMTDAIGEAYLGDNDYIVDATLYAQLQSATGWDSNNEITLGGNKYRRMRKADATCATTGNDKYYDWFDSTTYHYFKYQPIKWRVLRTNGAAALLLADECLDDVKWNSDVDYGNDWATSEMRSWLNSYGASSNTAGTDYSSIGFLSSAFTATEKAAIVNGTVQNNVTGDYSDGSGTSATDRVFLLSRAESRNGAYGFSTDYDARDEARRAQASTYARARGTEWNTFDCGKIYWWLRSAGYSSSNACFVYDVGCGGDHYCVKYNYLGVRPALKMNLTSSCWSYAGTVCTDGTVKLAGWQETNGKTYYYDTDGNMVTDWQTIDGKQYYFDDDGAMATGWRSFLAKGRIKIRYYFKSNGEMATGWLKISGTYYYFNAAGIMQKGWLESGSAKYYLQTSGAMATGWLQIDSKWYYFASSGAMSTGKWIKSGTKWYYVGTDGVMAVSESLAIKGKTYNFDANGVCTNP